VLEQRLERVRENLVRSIANEHLVLTQAVMLRDSRAQRMCCRIGILAERVTVVAEFAPDCIDYAR
jgi:hypothetical protein